MYILYKIIPKFLSIAMIKSVIPRSLSFPALELLRWSHLLLHLLLLLSVTAFFTELRLPTMEDTPAAGRQVRDTIRVARVIRMTKRIPGHYIHKSKLQNAAVWIPWFCLLIRCLAESTLCVCSNSWNGCNLLRGSHAKHMYRICLFQRKQLGKGTWRLHFRVMNDHSQALAVHTAST